MMMGVAVAVRAGASAIEGAVLDGLDGARAAVLTRAGRLPGVARLRRERELRLGAVMLGSIVVAFSLSVWATLPLLALAPVLLGIPHVASDVRYLLARPEPALRLPVRAVAPVLALFAASLLLGLCQVPRLAAAAGGLAVLWAGLATASSRRARALFLALGLVALLAALARPAAAGMVIAQGHNLVAVTLAGWLARRQLASGWLAAALIGVGVAALLSGACDDFLATPAAGTAAIPWAETAWQQTVAAVTPSGLDPVLARRWVALFAFAQALHYSAWIHVVPDALRASARPVSFRRSYLLLRADLGPALARAVVILSVALPIAACLSFDGARGAYLGLSVFHAYLELAAVAVLVLSRFPR
jgi:hypothetical protein